MKKVLRSILCLLVMTLLSSFAAYAAPEGYMEIELTRKNFKKYFELTKTPGNNGNEEFYFRCKLLKKGYCIYIEKKYGVTATLNISYKTKLRKGNLEDDFDFHNVGDSVGFGTMNGYQMTNIKLLSYKIKKAKGKLILVEPDNLIGVESPKEKDQGYMVKVKKPYDDSMPCESHYDKELKETVVDYYYFYTFKKQLP
jgi:hypothetical protein